MVAIKAQKPEDDTTPVSPPTVYYNASPRILHLEKGIFHPGQDVDATEAEKSTLCEFIKPR